LNNKFFDIVFDVIINIDSYDFINDEFKESSKKEKYLWKVGFIGLNAIILIGCLYTLIFILIPIVKFRILMCSRKREQRYNVINERIGNNNISLMTERLTTDTN
jgi:hypothetical protein